MPLHVCSALCLRVMLRLLLHRWELGAHHPFKVLLDAETDEHAGAIGFGPTPRQTAVPREKPIEEKHKPPTGRRCGNGVRNCTSASGNGVPRVSLGVFLTPPVHFPTRRGGPRDVLCVLGPFKKDNAACPRNGSGGAPRLFWCSQDYSENVLEVSRKQGAQVPTLQSQWAFRGFSPRACLRNWWQRCAPARVLVPSCRLRLADDGAALCARSPYMRHVARKDGAAGSLWC